jgi:hypothetical protein
MALAALYRVDGPCFRVTWSLRLTCVRNSTVLHRPESIQKQPQYTYHHLEMYAITINSLVNYHHYQILNNLHDNCIVPHNHTET